LFPLYAPAASVEMRWAAGKREGTLFRVYLYSVQFRCHTRESGYPEPIGEKLDSRFHGNDKKRRGRRVREKRTDFEVAGIGPEFVGSEIANFIRMKSRSEELVTSREIFEALSNRGILKPANGEQLQESEAFLKEAIDDNGDLKEVLDGKGNFRYYSTQSMAEPYARILSRKGENAVLLMAEVIRENSQRYPRPVPLELFEGPPFDLTPDEILSCLKEMAGSVEYQDIAQTTSSIGTVFLFSKLHLEPDYASMLAEWIDVGQSKSP
jgi:hypothetical protein